MTLRRRIRILENRLKSADAPEQTCRIAIEDPKTGEIRIGDRVYGSQEEAQRAGAFTPGPGPWLIVDI